VSRTRPDPRYPGRIRAAAIIIPAVLLAALILLDYVVLGRLLPPGQSHLVVYAIGLAGVIAFSVVILDRLSGLAARERAQARRVAELAEDLQAKRVQLQALNAAGISLSAELSTDHVLEKIADLARVVTGARYAALGIFDREGTVTDFITSGITPEQRAAIGPLPKGRGILGLLPREGRPIRLRDLHDHPASVGFPPEPPADAQLSRRADPLARHVGRQSLSHRKGRGRRVHRGRRRGPPDARRAGGDRDRERAAVRAGGERLGA